MRSRNMSKSERTVGVVGERLKWSSRRNGWAAAGGEANDWNKGTSSGHAVSISPTTDEEESAGDLKILAYLQVRLREVLVRRLGCL